MEEIEEKDFTDIESGKIDRPPYMWKCCLCGTTDPRLLKYLISMFMILSIMAFSAAMLSQADSCQDSSLYVGLITFLFGLICPNPKIDEK